MKLAMKKTLLALGILIALPSVASAATLSVSPAQQTVKTGEVFTVTVRLDTQGTSIDGVDLRYLTFNPSLLQVQDANSSQAGVQITPDSLMALTVLNSADNSMGKIAFSQVATGGTKYKGSGILATISFKAVAGGTASLMFNHTPKSTTDSNVAAAGEDVLTAVINGSYTISGTAPKVTETAKINSTPTKTTVTPSIGSDGRALPEVTGSPIPETDTSDFQYSEKKGFWATVVSLIKDFFSSFISRLRGTK